MNLNTSNSRQSLWWKIPVIFMCYSAAVMIAGGVITAIGMQWPAFPGEASETTNFLLSLVGSVLMAVCMALLAVGLWGSTAVRWITLAAFCYVAFGLNNQIEAAIFTTFGGTSTMLVFFLLPCLAGAAAAVLLLPPNEPEAGQTTIFHRGGVSNWWWRVVVAWLAFPMIYIFFGMLASPIVVPVYQQQDFGLTLPGMGTIIPVALVRSALYLAVTIPVMMMWSRSRRSLVLTLGIAFFAMMGLIGLATTTFFPPVLRIAHSIEILCDAVVYAWLLVALFVPKDRVETTQPVLAAAE
jgi:hypothetical protein